MSSDLDEIFDRIGDFTDRAPLGLASAARRHGRLRRQRSALTAAGAAMLALVVLLAGWQLRPVTDPQPAEPSPSLAPPLTFTALRPLGEPSWPALPQEQYASVATGAGRIITARFEEPPLAEQDGNIRAEQGGNIRLAATDANSGAPLWGPLALPERYILWAGIRMVSDMLVVAAEPKDQVLSAGIWPDMSALGVDPATGQVRWRHSLVVSNAPLVIFGSVLVLQQRAQNATVGVDVRTGSVLWSVPGTSVREGTVAWESDGDRVYGSGRSSGLGMLGSQLSGRERRVVQVMPTGRVRVLDAGVGTVLSERGAVDLPPAQNYEFLALDGMLYRTGHDNPGAEILQVPIIGDAPVTRLYAAPAGSRISGGPTPCGRGTICVGQARNGRAELALVETDGGRTRWTRQVSYDEAGLFIQVMGGLVLTRTGKQSAVLDLAGKHLLGPAVLGPGTTWVDGDAAWIDSGNLLIWGSPGDELWETSVRGLSLAGGTVTELGKFKDRGACAWDTRTLICPTVDGVQRWLFSTN